MAEIKVTPSQLRGSSDTLTRIGGQFNEVMEDIMNKMKTMKNEWVGEAAEAFINGFTPLRNNIVAYRGVIDDYALFLKTAADEYEKAEKSVQNSTEEITNDLFQG